jgi:hypothetical protein
LQRPTVAKRLILACCSVRFFLVVYWYSDPHFDNDTPLLSCAGTHLASSSGLGWEPSLSRFHFLGFLFNFLGSKAWRYGDDGMVHDVTVNDTRLQSMKKAGKAGIWFLGLWFG